ncbi:hypothetical protein [Ligilactobacillus acidipiscis]|uniref:IS66 family transposase n=1 Tax=Ligilactobacillus acidipiscis TaxID=89059 RepID=UPI0023F97861|nr:hypothetical protein [Ligilactobacillus acidipiscis]WEV56568.1 hypothetical protein OZX66_10115 [Ligilactobacillus acidipiscis]
MLLYFKNQLFGQKSERTKAQDPDRLFLFGGSGSVLAGQSSLTNKARKKVRQLSKNHKKSGKKGRTGS